MVLLHMCQAPLDFMLSGRLDSGDPVGLGLIPNYNLSLMVCETLGRSHEEVLNFWKVSLVLFLTWLVCVSYFVALSQNALKTMGKKLRKSSTIQNWIFQGSITLTMTIR